MFSKIADRKITVDMIVQNIGAEGKADISFTVNRDELAVTLEAVAEAAAELGAGGYSHDDQVAKISVVGLGMARQVGVAQKMFRALADAGVNILVITTSEIKISVLVARSESQAALRAVHAAFDLATRSERQRRADRGRGPVREASALEIIRRLQGMEDLTIDEMSLDQTQSLVTIYDVPDRLGVAAAAFDELGQGGRVRRYDRAKLRPRRAGQYQPHGAANRARPHACELAEQIAKRHRLRRRDQFAKVAKLSVSGIGMRSNTSVAIRMFESLAAAGINVDMMSTSEVRVNVIVDGRQAEAALGCLQRAFADAQK